MKNKIVIIGTLFYVLITFPLAIIWHIVLFKPFYVSIGYFGENPSFLLGFLAILIQGIMLSLGFSLLKLKGKPILQGLKYALFMGIFFWSSHVVAFTAKQQASNVLEFYFFETIYLILQFGIYGTLIGSYKAHLEK